MLAPRLLLTCKCRALWGAGEGKGKPPEGCVILTHGGPRINSKSSSYLRKNIAERHWVFFHIFLRFNPSLSPTALVFIPF